MRLLIAATFTLCYIASAQYARMEVPFGLSPRYYLEGVVKRQSGLCTDSSKEHSCMATSLNRTYRY